MLQLLASIIQLQQGRDQNILSMLQLQLGARGSLTETGTNCAGPVRVAVAVGNLAINQQTIFEKNHLLGFSSLFCIF